MVHFDSADKKMLNKLVEWRQFCKENSIQQDMAFSHFKKLKNLLMISSVSLSTLAGILNILTLPSESEQDRPGGFNVLGFLATVSSLVSGSIIVIQNNMKYSEKSQVATQFSAEYGKLQRELGAELYLIQSGENVYKSVAEFFKRMSSRMADITGSAPPIPGSVMNKFKKQCNGLESSITFDDTIFQDVIDNKNNNLVDSSNIVVTGV